MSNYLVIQAIPLYSSVDEGPTTYFRDHKAEVEGITGEHLIVAVPRTVVEGEAGDIYSASDSKRYPGLKLDQMPCLWLESVDGTLALPMPREKEQINKLLLQVTQAAKDSTSWEEFKKKVGKASSQRPGGLIAGLTFNPLEVLREAIAAVPANGLYHPTK